MTPDQLKEWRGKRTQSQAAKLIGLSREHYSDMELGRHRIMPTTELACCAVEMGIYSYDQLKRRKK